MGHRFMRVRGPWTSCEFREAKRKTETTEDREDWKYRDYNRREREPLT
jgi:hypothetical protein